MFPTFPKWLRVVLGLLATAVAVLNQSTFRFGSTWHTYLTIASVAFGFLAVPALLGSAFQDWFVKVLPPKWFSLVKTVVAIIMALATVGLTDNSWGPTVHSIIVGVITFIGSLGFYTSPSEPAPVVAAPPVA